MRYSMNTKFTNLPQFWKICNTKNIWIHEHSCILDNFEYLFCYLQTPLGGIHLPETKKKFLEGSLHPANVLMCPHTCVTNLPKPREHRPGKKHMYPCIIKLWMILFARCTKYEDRKLTLVCCKKLIFIHV